MTKLAILTGLVVVSLSATACTVAPEEDVTEAAAETGEENVGEASGALSKIDTVGNIPWGAQAGWTSDLWIQHTIWNVQNKQITVDAGGNFPTMTGTYTTQKFNDCKDSVVELHLYKRANGAQPWTHFATHTKNATPNVVFDFDTGQMKITSCVAIFEMWECDAINFVTSTEMRADVLAWGGDGSVGQKIDVVRRPQINLLNCD